MRSKRPPALIEQYGSALARAIGTRRFAVMLGMFGFYVAVNLFSSFTDEILKQWAPFARALPLLIAGAMFWLFARRARDRVMLSVVQTTDVQKCEVLVLLLSPPGKDEQEFHSWLADGSIRGRISDVEVRKRFTASWRKPMEAVAAHLPRLKRVIVLGSSDSRGAENGTYHKFPLFREVLKHLLPRPEHVEISDLSSPAFGERWATGVNFEDLQALVAALQDVLKHLENVKPYEVMIDITGGQKVPTVAGAAVSLGEGRRFQYVSTLDQLVTVYDLTYESEE